MNSCSPHMADLWIKILPYAESLPVTPAVWSSSFKRLMSPFYIINFDWDVFFFLVKNWNFEWKVLMEKEKEKNGNLI